MYTTSNTETSLLLIPNDPFVLELLHRLSVPVSFLSPVSQPEKQSLIQEQVEEPVSSISQDAQVDTKQKVTVPSLDSLQALLDKKIAESQSISSLPTTPQVETKSEGLLTFSLLEMSGLPRLQLPLTYSSTDSNLRDNKVERITVKINSSPKANPTITRSFVEIKMSKPLSLSQWSSYIRLIEPKLLFLDSNNQECKPLPLSSIKPGTKNLFYFNSKDNAHVQFLHVYPGYINQEGTPFLNNHTEPSLSCLLVFNGSISNICRKDLYSIASPV